MKLLIKNEWPAIIASFLVAAAFTCAALTIVNFWPQILATLK